MTVLIRASKGLHSFRVRCMFGWVYIGVDTVEDELIKREVLRSTDSPDWDTLEYLDESLEEYVKFGIMI